MEEIVKKVIENHKKNHKKSNETVDKSSRFYSACNAPFEKFFAAQARLVETNHAV